MGRKKLPEKDFIWTPELSYVVGLLVTDGNLSSDERHIIMRSSDVDLLETFRKCLNIEHCKIGRSQNGNVISHRVQFGDIQFYKWLLKIGLFPHKTYTIGKIDIPNKYFRDFLRGHLDGDGSITTYIDRWNTFKSSKYVYTRLCVRFLSASEEHLLWLREKIIELLGVQGSFHERKPTKEKRVSMFILKFGKKESIKLLSQLYYNKELPCLKRKRTIAEKFMS